MLLKEIVQEQYLMLERSKKEWSKKEREKKEYNHQAVYIIEKNETGKQLVIYQISEC